MDRYDLRLDTEVGLHFIGEGSIGGKADGLVSLKKLLANAASLTSDFPGIAIHIPQCLVIGGSVFETFIAGNGLAYLGKGDETDEIVAAAFLKGRMPEGVTNSLRRYLEDHSYPLAVRSSGMLEDTLNHAYAGLYRTYMLSNDQPRMEERIENLIRAVKLVYASTFYESPKAYAKRIGHRPEAWQMAVIVQQVAGAAHKGYFYPAISGVAQSLNYYPPTGTRPEDGVATIALGMGKQVVSGERALQFSPKYPKGAMQHDSVEDVLAHAQRRFYAVELEAPYTLDARGRDHLVRRHVSEAEDELPVKMLAGTYVLAEHRIKETVRMDGPRVLTFAGVLKYDLFPLAGLLRRLLAMGETAMKVPVELEFAVDLASSSGGDGARFSLLQMRPMTASKANISVTIESDEKKRARCYSRHAIGNHDRQPISDVIYVKPAAFDPGQTRSIARDVARLNAHAEGLKRRYLLVGPGRWGSADPWLGIPVRWTDISGVAAIVETASDKLNVEPSTGAHFFHNLVSLGISYLSVTRQEPDHFSWAWLEAQEISLETEYAAYVQLPDPVELKVDGRTSSGVIMLSSSTAPRI
jgi:hypothetical protein